MSFSSLGPLERDVMDVVWRKKERTVKEVWSELQPSHQIAYTTVMTILSRLFTKGVVDRRKVGKGFVYTAKASKQATIQSLIKQTMASLVDRFGDEAIAAFIDEVHELKQPKKS